MSKLFQPIQINGLRLSNRFVRSATWEGMATEDGRCTGELVDLMAGLARGEVGLIITGHAYVHPRGQAGPLQLGIYDDKLLPGLTRMVEAVHARSGKIVAQLAHAGLYADPQLTGARPLAPSALNEWVDTDPQAMTTRQIAETVEDFARAADRAMQAGFDGVQIHAAHGYLLSQFLSPAFNHRKDRYGGTPENRATLLLEVLERIRNVVGDRVPVLIKMNCGDFIEDGLDLEGAVGAARMLEQNGIDAIEISGGTGASGKLRPVRTGIKSKDDEAYFRNEAAVFRKQVTVPLMLVGGIRSFEIADDIVGSGTANLVSMSRPFIREPELVKRWKSGDHTKSTCLSDNRCFVPIRGGKGAYCVMEKREKSAPEPS